jgi:hypothetical protein
MTRWPCASIGPSPRRRPEPARRRCIASDPGRSSRDIPGVPTAHAEPSAPRKKRPELPALPSASIGSGGGICRSSSTPCPAGASAPAGGVRGDLAARSIALAEKYPMIWDECRFSVPTRACAGLRIKIESGVYACSHDRAELGRTGIGALHSPESDAERRLPPRAEYARTITEIIPPTERKGVAK